MDQLSPTATSSVQIYREDADAVEMGCLQDSHMEGCAGRHHYRRGIFAGLLALPLILVVDLMFHKR